MPFFQKINNLLLSFARRYKLDPRALSVMRIGLALVIMADLFIRIQDLTAHYTDAGMWPLEMLEHSGWKTGYWSLHALSGGKMLTLCLFVLQFILAGTLLLGYYSRLSAFLLYLLYISLHNRNIFILQAGDDLLRICLLWASMLPIGARYSLDDNKRKRKGQSLTSIGPLVGLGYLLLIASVYLFTVLLKSGADWRENFSAVYYALNLAQLSMPFGHFLLQYPQIHQALTVFVLLVEIVIPILILWPSKTGSTRTFAFALILVLQIGFGLSLYVGLFYIIAIVNALALLSPKSMDRVERVLKIKTAEEAQTQTPKILLFEVFALILIPISLMVNLSGLPKFEYELSPPFSETVNALRLDQYWGMFSPGVLRKDGWLVYHGSDSIGRQWDLRLNQDYVDYHEPKSIVAMYRSDRWRKWAENMQDERFTFLRPLYCQYILKHFNQKVSKRKIKVLHLYFMEKETLPDFQKPITKKILYCVCND